MPRATGDPTALSKGARTRQRILTAAAHEFAQRGFDGMTLRSVAEGADLHLGSLYFHFASKDELVAAAISEAIASAHDNLQQAVDDLPPATPSAVRFRTAIRSHLEVLHADHDRSAAVLRMASTVPPSVRASFADQEHRFGALWLKLVRQAQQDGDLDPNLDAKQVRDLLMGALNSTLLTVRPTRSALDRAAGTAYQLWVNPDCK